MVTSQPIQQTDLFRRLAALREGLRSLKITGPFPALEETHQQALEQVRQRPTLEEREAALNRAWQASSRAVHLLRTGHSSQAVRAVEDMYSHVQAAISATRRVV